MNSFRRQAHMIAVEQSEMTHAIPKSPTEPAPEALLKLALEYQTAAESLLLNPEKVKSPIYFLFSHAIELALKAFLRTFGQSVPRGPKGHDLEALLDAC